MYEFTTLNKVPIQKIHETMLSSFSNYYVPIKISLELLKIKNMSYGVDYRRSFGALYKGELIGFIFIAFDYYLSERTIYNAGMGVNKEHRGKGVAQNLQNLAIDIAKKELDANVFLLEVIKENKEALPLYLKKGFNITRELESYGLAKRIGKVKKQNQIKFEILDFKLDLINQSWWDTYPSWQNTIQSCNRSKLENKIAITKYKDEEIGYCVFNMITGQIHILAVKPEARGNLIAQNLLKFIDSNLIEGVYINMINIDATNKPLIGLCNTLGFKHIVSQYEMKLKV